MQRIKLSDWKLCGFWPYTPFLGNSVETQAELRNVTPWIKASVPGGIYRDLQGAGLIEDPFFDTNSLKCEWVANRWWLYETEFAFKRSEAAKRVFLVFKGVDYKAHFYLNNSSLGTHEGMYTARTFDISEIVQDGGNRLRVLFEHAPDEMAQIGYTDRTHTQKARFNYHWDFSTRLVNIGLYDEVFLYETGEARLDDVYIRAKNARAGDLAVDGLIISPAKQKARLKIECAYKGKTIAAAEEWVRCGENGSPFSVTLTLDSPRLWYPNGHGEQPLYTFTVSVFDGGGILSDRYSLTTGIRDVSYRMNDGSPADAYPYTIVINGMKIYGKGVNMVPLDMEYGTVTAGRYEKFIKLVRNANVNLIRVWGGGLIESDVFYQLCDRYGIMVFQEFIQSSSGISNLPCVEPGYLDLLEKTCVSAVKRIRSHACHVVWSGGNELQYPGSKPVGYEHENIRLLQRIVKELDPSKLFLPTSASGPREFLDINKKGENYDVHGPWKFGGVKAHYTIFNRSDCLLHSEFGCDGLACLESLKKFLSPENIGVFNTDNYTWRHHGDWWDTFRRDEKIFGPFESVEDYITASQFIQAQALQYALEANRSRAFQNSGSIVWQANEPFPNVSCTSVIDYYLRPKLAYYMTGVAYRPVHAALKYHALVYQPGELFTGVLRVFNDTHKPVNLALDVKFTASGGGCLFSKSYGGVAADRQCGEVEEITFTVPPCKSFEAVIAYDDGGSRRRSCYLFLVQSADGRCEIEEVKKFLTRNSDAFALAR